MAKQLLFLFLIAAGGSFGRAMDTLYTNPNYPPIVYSQADYSFYRYTAKYSPNSLYEAFCILGTHAPEVIARFVNRSESEVISKGMFYKSARMRKEFCLTGYSNFVLYFHQKGIFYPEAMETYILLGFHQYLKQEKIAWTHNKVVALDGHKKVNRLWKKRRKKLFKKGEFKLAKEKAPNSKKEGNHPDDLFWGEFDSKFLGVTTN